MGHGIFRWHSYGKPYEIHRKSNLCMNVSYTALPVQLFQQVPCP